MLLDHPSCPCSLSVASSGSAQIRNELKRCCIVVKGWSFSLSSPRPVVIILINNYLLCLDLWGVGDQLSLSLECLVITARYWN